MSKDASSMIWMWYEKVMRNASWIVKLFTTTGEEIHLTYMVRFTNTVILSYCLKDFQRHLKGPSGQII